MHKFTGETVDIDRDVLATLRARGGSWAVYQNVDMSSLDIGRLTFLKFGEGCTFGEPPEKAPDGPHGMGWRYCHVGNLNEDKTVMAGADGQEFKVVESEPEPGPPTDPAELKAIASAIVADLEDGEWATGENVDATASFEEKVRGLAEGFLLLGKQKGLW